MGLTVEYRIPLPLTSEEYRIAQLYMLSKKSRQESHGEDSGIEILVNEPYTDGPGPDGCGQYTRKVYYVGSHLPAWMKSLIPKAALAVEEEAWNAYPYTKTRFTCPFVEKFSIEVETYYFDDGGHQENVFNLNKHELKQREIDIIDIVRDALPIHEYNEEEDPKKFVSQKTFRGPLNDDWINDYWSDCQGKETPLPNGKAIMCAYKLCKVEFRYWGMQNKIEKYIHDFALRKTMLRAHLQAWAWLDEWWGLSIEDIRNLEKETQALLAKKYGKEDSIDEAYSDDKPDEDTESQVFSSATNVSHHSDDVSRNEAEDRRYPKVLSRNMLSSHVNMRMESIRRESVTSASDEEFFDCQEDKESSIHKWSSLEILPQDDAYLMTEDSHHCSESYYQEFRHRLNTEPCRCREEKHVDSSVPTTPTSSPLHIPCSISLLVLVVHAGSVLDCSSEVQSKKSDVITFKGSFEFVIRQHYPHLVGRVAVRLIGASSVFTEILNILSSLNPVDVDSGLNGYAPSGQIPVSALPLLGTLRPEYDEAVSKLIEALNSTYLDFTHAEGHGFRGQICLVGDSVGGLMCYDALSNADEVSSREKQSSGEDLTHVESFRQTSSSEAASHESIIGDRQMSGSQKSSVSSEKARDKIMFDVNSLFLFGCPLALVLVHRKLVNNEKADTIIRPVCDQVYNLFHPTDPLAVRLEPLISARFSLIPTVTIPRYAKYPLGDGQPTSLLECIQSKENVFQETCSSFSPTSYRRRSNVSINSCATTENHSFAFIKSLSKRWWGTKRLDYSLYCPEGLSNFPPNSLPHLFHASYWESLDVVAFILRQLVKPDSHEAVTEGKEISPFLPSLPREKWLRKRTSVKVKNIAANHRGNDILIKKGATQEIQGRFMYGPLDMVTLTGEKIDLHIMKNPPGGNWDYVGTTVTDKNGRISFQLPKHKQMNCGIFPVKAIVRGDHSTSSLYLAVIPPNTQCVVFSIDGSFTASVSVTGKDPKVRAGAVDVVRHWQELGYLIIYVTGRPDMQKRKVVSWLVQHNFPHGLVSFADGLSTDPLGHKTDFIKSLVQECEVNIEAAYGSSKDITVYSNAGLKANQIYIVGKTSKKQHISCQVLIDGYAAHLSHISSMENAKPAKGNPEMVIPKGFFGLPGYNSTLRRRRSAKRTASHPVLGASPNEGILQARSTLHSTPGNSTAKCYKY